MFPKGKIKGTSKAAPYGRRKDGTPRKKPGRKRMPESQKKKRLPSAQRKKHYHKKSAGSIADNPTTAARKSRGGFKVDGTPMPDTHDERGFLKKGAVINKMGRPKGSFSVDTIIRKALQQLHGQSKETVIEVLAKKVLGRGITVPRAGLSVLRFATERVDGKAVQPIKDVSPGLRLAHLSDEQLDELLAKAGVPQPDPKPEPDPKPKTETSDAKASGSDEGADEAPAKKPRSRKRKKADPKPDPGIG